MDKNTITELNNILDGFTEKFSQLSIDEQIDFLHSNSFLDTVYSKGWDDSNEFYRGNGAEDDEDEDTVSVSDEYIGTAYCNHCSRYIPYKAYNVQTEYICTQPSSLYEEEFDYIICPHCGRKVYDLKED